MSTDLNSIAEPTNAPSEKVTAILPNTWWGEMRALLIVGLPIMATQVVQFSVHVCDTIMLARLGSVELAAAALGGAISALLWVIGNGPASAVTPLISQALGRDTTERRDARRSIRMAIWMCFALIPLILLVVIGARPALIALGQDPLVSTKAAHYLAALAPALPFIMATIVLRNFLAAIDKTLGPFLIILAGTLLNIGLNYLLIFGHWGLPALGVVGAGLATSIANILVFFGVAFYVYWDKQARDFKAFHHFLRPDWPRFAQIFRLAWPISVTIAFEFMLFNAATLIFGIIGITEQAAYQIALNIVAVAFMLPWGLAMGGSVRIGLAHGAKNDAARRRAASTTLSACALIIGLCALGLYIWPDQIAQLYLGAETGDTALAAQDLRRTLFVFLPLAAALILLDGGQIIFNQLLRGLGDVRWPMMITGLFYWGVGFPLCFGLALYTDIGAPGVWYGLMTGLICVSLSLGIRLWHCLRQPV